MLKTYQYRLYPSLYQKQILSIQFGHNRFIWNNTLNYLQGEYQKYLYEKVNNPEIKQKSINLSDIIKRLPILKQEIEWLSLAHSQTLQATMKRLDQSFQMFFKKKGSHPKFKRKTDEQSIEFPQQTKIDFDMKCVKIPKLGYTKIALDRRFFGKIKTCYVKKNKINQYFVSFVVDDGLAYPETDIHADLTGIDLGIKDLVITSKGEKIPNNKFLKKKLHQLKKAQKELSRRSKKKYKLIVVHEEMYGPNTKENPVSHITERKLSYSSNREKSRLRVAKLHRDVANARKDYLHKLSTKLVTENQGLVFESLNIRGMVKNRRLSQAISDCGWGMLYQFCEYKSLQQGKICLKINQFIATSKTCHVCKEKYHGLTLSEREWTCETCGTIHDRDINASINICEAGYNELDRLVGADYFTGMVERLNTPKRSKFKKKQTLDEGFATLLEIESGGIKQLASNVSILLKAGNDKTQVAS